MRLAWHAEERHSTNRILHKTYTWRRKPRMTGVFVIQPAKVAPKAIRPLRPVFLCLCRGQFQRWDEQLAGIVFQHDPQHSPQWLRGAPQQLIADRKR